MKLKIDIEVTPEEVPLATELLAALHALAAHVESRVQLRSPPPILHLLSAVQEDPSCVEEIGGKLHQLFEEQGNDKLLADFSTAFTTVVLEGDLVQKEKPVVPFVYLVSKLPEPYKTQARDLLIAQIIKFLTVNRAADCVRAEFFCHAEAFAALVKLEFVPIKGAITTIITLLQKVENQCAALTMLGKTVELCLDLLTEKCDASSLANLHASLDAITDPAFTYDVQYIKDNMNWQEVDGGAAQPPVASTQGTLLSPFQSYDGHRNIVFSLAYDHAQETLISASKDGHLIMWRSGQQQDSFELSRHYACSMDVNPHHRILYMCGVSKEGGSDAYPAIIAYRQNEYQQWEEFGVLEKSETKVISSIKASVGSGNQFVTGETMKEAADHPQSVVCCYDVHASSSFQSLKPVAQFDEHMDIITCLTAVPRSEHSYLSGSRDLRVLLWDIRLPKSVGSFVGHEGTVTSVTATDTLVVTGGLDKCIMTFDMRTMGPRNQPLSSIVLDESAVLKVAFGTGTEIAASTLLGLYQVDASGGAFQRIKGFVDSTTPATPKPIRYHDLAWGHGNQILFAAGDGMRIDAYRKLPS